MPQRTVVGISTLIVDVETFWSRVQALTVRADQLDMIYDMLDDLALAGQFDVVDQLLAVVPDGLAESCYLSIIAITWPWRRQLVHRASIVARFDRIIT